MSGSNNNKEKRSFGDIVSYWAVKTVERPTPAPKNTNNKIASVVGENNVLDTATTPTTEPISSLVVENQSQQQEHNDSNNNCNNSTTASMSTGEHTQLEDEHSEQEEQLKPIRTPASTYVVGELRVSGNSSGYDNQVVGDSIESLSSSYQPQSSYSTDAYSVSSSSYSTYQPSSMINRDTSVNMYSCASKSSYSSSYTSANQNSYSTYSSSGDVDNPKTTPYGYKLDYDDDSSQDTTKSNIYQIECLPTLQDESAPTITSAAAENNWNEIFQDTLDLPDSEEKFRKLSNIANDFVYCADTFGKIIISELHLPEDLKTIKPLALGGVAGGLKFKCHDIIFKFVVDTELIPGHWMYGGAKRSDEKAQKSAGHEIKGLNHFMELSSNTLRFPLMATIDYRGYRILAISSLPINKKTIVYGSCDGGQTVHDSDPIINKEMERIANILNLRGHQVGCDKKVIFGPGDIEVHRGFDGRAYMVDFARIFPPEYPCILKKDQEVGREIFYSMCRPELILRSKVPLSSDGFSGWQTGDDVIELNDDIVAISEKLHKEIIPQCISALEASVVEPTAEENTNHSSYFTSGDESLDSSPQDDGDDQQQYLLTLKDAGFSKGSAERDYTQKATEIIKLLNFIHSKGVNIRYLGLICQSITNRFVRNLFLTEVVARVWKKIIRSRLREMMDLTKRPSEGPYKQIISDIFELILSTNKSKNKEFWTSTEPGNFKFIALKVFPKCLSQSDISPNLDLRSVIDTKLLVYRIIQMLHIRVNADAFSQFLSNPKYIISDKDMEEVGSVVKYPNIIDFASGSMLIYESQRISKQSDVPPEEVKRWIDNSQIKLQNALRSMPLSIKVLIKLSLTFLLRANLSTDSRESIERLKNAILLIKQAPSIQKNQPKLLALHAMIQLKLATLYLFYVSDYQGYQREIQQARQKLHLAIAADYWSAEEFLEQSLPIYQKDSDSPVGFNMAFIEKRKVNEMITLGLMRIEVAKDTSEASEKLLNYIDYVFKKISYVGELSVPFSLEQLVSSLEIEQIIGKLTELSFIHLSKIPLNSNVCNSIVSMKNLSHLRLSHVDFTSQNPPDAPITNYNQFLKSLLTTNPQLEKLYIASKWIQDDSFEGIYSHFTKLKSLSIVGTDITDKTAFGLAPYLTDLTSLSFSGSTLIKDDGLIVCLESIKSLSHLSISFLDHLTDRAGLAISKHAADIEELYMISSRFSPDVFSDIVKQAPKLKILDVSYSNANQAMIEGLQHHGAENLVHLNLSQTDPVDPESFIEDLSILSPNLKFLHLPRPFVPTESVWKLIRKLNDLEDLKFPDRFYLKGFVDHFSDPNFKEDHEEPLYNLKTLDLTSSTVSLSALKKIMNQMPLLESLSLSAVQFVDENSYCYNANDETLSELGPIVYNLKELNLSNHPLDKGQITSLISRCPNLRVLHLWGCKKITSQHVYDLGLQHPHITID
ncbi:hypothetical protein CYY_001883 [Polysphondylium violaceum]|uniref:Clu domain-containing protein n=1 Tax=Polysphondylium violaceum TaxID=133409 RepID=A0A8J4PZD1_9MYCE|nr:hypothetical protein CYY_001883 [Polysphondylium violaceum]